MTKWIRWGGLIAFLVIGGLITAFFMLLAGPLLKHSIEKYGTELNGAVVETHYVGLSFSPIGVRINGLQVTDAKKPMRNAMQFDNALIELELAPLFVGKFIVRDVRMTGLQFDTERSKSGAISKPKESNVAAKEPSFIDNIEVPSAEEILARETFLTDTAGDAFQKAYEANKAIIDQRLAAVPTDADIKRYEADINALTAERLKSVEDFKARTKALDELKKRFEADQNAIRAARNAIATAQNEVGGRLQELKNAPKKDIDNLLNKYQLNASGAVNISSLLFGSEAGEWAATTLHWYGVVKPYLEKNDAESADEEQAKIPRGGFFVNFPSNNPWPSALLRKADLTAHFTSGNLLIDIRDITNEQAILGRPARIMVNGSQLKSVEDLTATAVFDHRKKPGVDSLNIQVKNWAMAPLDLGLGGAELKSANVQMKGQATITANQLNAEGSADFLAAHFIADGKTVFSKELGKALGGIHRFTVSADAKGRVTSPAVSIRSDLDRQLSDAFGRRLKEEQKALEQKLEREIQAKLKDKLGKYGDEYAQLGSLDGSLDNKLKKVRDLASTQIDDYAAQEKREAQEKLDREKAEAREKLKKLF